MISYISDNFDVLNFANTKDSNEFTNAIDKIKKVLKSCTNTTQRINTQKWATQVLINSDRFLSKIVYVSSNGFGSKNKTKIRNTYLNVVTDILYFCS